ncbi:hypothetical protein GA0115259_1016913 [Streptomyces sp. MnatMP-M17]|nr:hypothetical protein GA0115259_1016913 [Streptomyces sp. MnatMP-M17]
MSLREFGLGEIPAETERVARAVCPDGTMATCWWRGFGCGATREPARPVGRGLPALPLEMAHLRPDVPVVDGTVKAPNVTFIG